MKPTMKSIPKIKDRVQIQLVKVKKHKDTENKNDKKPS